MPILHRYLGNPVLSFIGRLFFKSRVGDFHCGLRAFTKKAFEKMDLKSSGMEFASEMVVKASMLRMSIREVPTTLRKDGRSRPPHLNTWRDGWRHLRFLIMYAPNWFLLYPGVLLMMFSLVLGGVLLVKPISVFHLQLDIHTLLYLMVAALLGTQLVFMYKVVKNYTLRHLFPIEHESMRKPSLEQSLIFGGVIFGIGIAWSFWNVGVWGDAGFGDLQPVLFMRCVIPAVFLISVGIQTIVTGFVVALIHDQRKV